VRVCQLDRSRERRRPIDRYFGAGIRRCRRTLFPSASLDANLQEPPRPGAVTSRVLAEPERDELTMYVGELVLYREAQPIRGGIYVPGLFRQQLLAIE